MPETCEEHEHCKESFEVLFKKMDRLDVAIRGNGKPGILIRLDRLEQDGRRQSKLIWLIIGAVITAGASYLFS